jgi:alkyl sulfatase BDS1-like metallo-beta-lactamase superfamily hydrolase
VRDRKKLPSKEEVVAGGVMVKRTFYRYDTFSLKDYKTAGGKVTAAMKPHVHTQSGESWTVKVLKPAK